MGRNGEEEEEDDDDDDDYDDDYDDDEYYYNGDGMTVVRQSTINDSLLNQTTF